MNWELSSRDCEIIIIITMIIKLESGGFCQAYKISTKSLVGPLLEQIYMASLLNVLPCITRCIWYFNNNISTRIQSLASKILLQVLDFTMIIKPNSVFCQAFKSLTYSLVGLLPKQMYTQVESYILPCTTKLI